MWGPAMQASTSPPEGDSGANLSLRTIAINVFHFSLHTNSQSKMTLGYISVPMGKKNCKESDKVLFMLNTDDGLSGSEAMDVTLHGKP